MNLHSDKEAFKEIIALAAEHFGYEQSHVEKDYWVSKILRDISLSEYADKTYFKGGTSLSKAYGLRLVRVHREHGSVQAGGKDFEQETFQIHYRTE